MITGTPLPPETLRALDKAVDDEDIGMVVVCGFPASGKSSAASYLAEKLSAVLFDKDGFAPGLEESVMEVLTGNPFDRDSETYRTHVGPHIYNALIDNALLVAECCSVVVDAPLLEKVRDAASRSMGFSEYLAEGWGIAVPVTTIWLSSAPETIKQRMIERGMQRDSSKLSDWETYRQSVLESGVDVAAKEIVDFFIPN